MNKFRILILSLLAAGFVWAEGEVVPEPHYGQVARRLAAALESRHVLDQRLDDVISQRAWTNLVTSYDVNRTVFLRSDIERLQAHELTIDDELHDGEVAFGYEVYSLYCQRLRERVDFATNLLATTTWDFSVDESYCFKRDEAAWPATREEAEELWRKRMKNEMLAIILSRELDAEEAARKKESKAAKAETDAAEEAEEDEEEEKTEGQKKASPEEILIKRYRMLLVALTEFESETVLQTYLSAVCRAYDPHTDYMSPMSKEEFDMGMNLKLCGVGAVLSFDDGAVKIVEIMPGGPIAVDGRIKTGDKIVGVKQGDGPVEDILWKPLNKTVRKIRGEKGTRVTLEIIPRNDPTGGSHKMIELVRDEIKLDDQRTTGRVERVTIASRERTFGYVKVPEFYGSMDRRPGQEGYVSCADDVLDYLNRFNTENVEGMILDLRGNGGGSLPEAIRMSSLFVPSGPVVYVRDGRSTMPLQIDRRNTVAFKRPLIVLIDRNSASASEIVAGHLRDVGRAIVLGDVRSHGKGTVQTVMPLGRRRVNGEEKDFGSTKITTMRFYRVNGRSTQVRGVSSDIHLPSFLDSLDIGEEKLPYALPFTRVSTGRVRAAWNLQEHVPSLAKLSTARTTADEKFIQHVKNVAAYKELVDRTEVSLERESRKAQMRADRQIRELEDGDADEDDEDEDEAVRARRRRKQAKRDDIVLQEAFRVLGDLVRETQGRPMPTPAADWYNAILGM